MPRHGDARRGAVAREFRQPVQDVQRRLPEFGGVSVKADLLGRNPCKHSLAGVARGGRSGSRSGQREDDGE